MIITMPMRHPEQPDVLMECSLECCFVPAAILRHKGLSHAAKLLYGLMARYAGPDGRCSITQTRLADEMGKSDRQIRRDIIALERVGFVERRVVGRGRGKSTRTEYVLRPC